MNHSPTPATLPRTHLRNLALLALALATSACATVTRHGDARLRDNKNVVFVVMDELVFPRIPVGQASTHRYRVRALPQAIYPDSFHLEVPVEEASATRNDQPWRQCLIRASLTTPEGVPFFTRTLDLSKDWNGDASAGRNSRRRSLRLVFTGGNFGRTSPLPRHLSYDLVIQVLRPSSRATDSLRVEALTVLPF